MEGGGSKERGEEGKKEGKIKERGKEGRKEGRKERRNSQKRQGQFDPGGRHKG